MSLKQEIETWVAALAAYDNNEFDNAIKCFEQIADTSKILFNCGVIHATLGEHARAVQCYQRAVQLDQYLAIAYFQQGVSNFLMGDFEEALANFNDTLLYLRGNNNIDYEQLGLKFKLYSCEVLFNRGLCYIYLQQKEAGMQDLIFATREKTVPDHDVIDEAIREQAEGYTVFSIPVGIVYRPNEAKVKNLKAKDYLGRARLVAAQEYQNSDPRRAAALAAAGVDDRPADKLSYAALNLVRPDLRSRGHRQQSEPPLRRDVFPPTPPPEVERPDSAHGSHHRRKSTESTSSERSNLQAARPAAKALRLELGVAAFEQQKSPEKQRPAPRRAESERPPMRRDPRDVPEVRIEEDPIAAYSEQVMQQQASSHQRTRSSVQRNQPVAIAEVEEDDQYSQVESPLAFEIIPPRSMHQRHKSQSHRAPELRKIRIKVHAEDMRYVMTTPTVTFIELSDQIQKKFGMQSTFKLKIKDEEGDLVTMADDDDLEMAMGTCRAAAAKDKVDMGKMELFVQETI
ncbi:hypothetical protein CERZMDRAFT_45761 [Cercospora zeae-maydis SCOH1-5]|uniref:PB1 domain-containing protein n=1 Tax=Cercospora zeae-maydis SCOH1-5 TaxID=717836 RepID=A0A6A6FA33_9PEZI|nr:hypothetical protein CERZMDRAFT_45761 [Cercospora zeae-maydis SCOH1-5]